MGRRLDRRSSVWGGKHGYFVWADDLTGGQVSGVENTDILYGQTT